IKQIGRKPELLDDPAVEGAVIKCISMLLPQLPRKHRYKIIFMTRAMEEVLASQSTMIGRLGTEGAKVDPEQLERGLNVHREDALRWMKGMRHIDFVEVDYAELVRAPQPIVATLAEFLGPEVLPNAAEMAAVVDPALYRKRHRAEGVPSDSSA
ncbi:MAG: hypothetical protein ACJ8KX_01515, partial [Chthoniobacterales bacterium]